MIKLFLEGKAEAAINKLDNNDQKIIKNVFESLTKEFAPSCDHITSLFYQRKLQSNETITNFSNDLEAHFSNAKA